MAQKDKVKELVGRGLNSYHTKALQQMDRIEKKNKEQNHKISILSNELDNDYLTKTEEGSVISLEHSKEGMVYLDELQGNTLVNYCTDGSKEMTLNGDIDVEGTFVTTTEGVDNGLVDVMCEGNTLVNLLPNKELKITCNNDWDNFYTIGRPNATSNITFGNTIQDVKPNTTYTLIYNVVTRPTSNHYLINNVNAGTVFDTYVRVYSDTPLGINKVVLTTLPDLTDKTVVLRQQNGTGRGEVYIKDYMLLEGDWTNKEIPQYFEGMKSVGECEDNKIEILSQNKNLVSELEVGGLNPSDGAENGNNGTFTIRNKGYIKVEPNTTYTLSIEDDNTFEGMVFHTYDINKKQIGYNPSSKFTLTTPNNAYYLRFRSFNADANNVNTNLKIQLEKGNIRTSYVPYSINKKEFLLNEPLRGLPNDTIKDKFVKIGGKWYIERNYSEVIIGKENDYISIQGTFTYNGVTYTRFRFEIDEPISNIEKSTTKVSYGISDKFKVLTVQANAPYTLGTKAHHLDGGVGKMIIYGVINETTTTISLAKEYLANNKVSLVYKLEKPTYEEITDVTLSTYLDITHISNNSIIPCNMKIQNTGYNAIIKPSTLYTVVLDTNKSGTIGMNLGGAKGTTTNNVLKLTTPATLTDDSLRLYGKGIKGSKVRLLEGDKTNWIPSHFEGMKSSFEDKFDTTDNTYKMEILSNNENLFNKEKLTDGEFVLFNGKNCYKYVDDSKYFSYISHFKRNTQYNISFKAYKETDKQGRDYNIQIVYTDGTRQAQNGRHNLLLEFISLPNKTISKITGNWNWGDRVYIDLDEFLIKEKSEIVEYIPHKSNKIQFSSIEPLRSASTIRDRIVFMDNKLKIERNCGFRILNGSENWSKYNNPTTKVTQFYTHNPKQKNGTSSGSCTTVPFTGGRNVNSEREGLGLSGGAGESIWVDVFNHKLTTVDANGFKDWLRDNNIYLTYALKEPTYEEVPHELSKIILEGYENGTLFFDTNIPPTSTVTYAGETPIVKSVKLNKTEVLNNTNDINNNIIPYLMDMDYRVVCLQLQSENINDGISMARLFGGTYEMLQRNIQSKRYSVDEYRHRLDAYLGANKITEEEYNKLGDMLNE